MSVRGKLTPGRLRGLTVVLPAVRPDDRYMNATAVRTRTGSKTIVTVTLPDGRVDVSGGKRAERAEAVILVQWAHQTELHVEGLRGSAAAAATEAAKYARGGWFLPGVRKAPANAMIPAAAAFTVPVTEAS